MTRKTLAVLTTDIGLAIDDNTTRNVTPADVRGVMLDVKDSFLHLDNFSILAQSGASIANTGNTTENVLATVNIGAGKMVTNGRLRITSLWSYTNSVNNKTPRIRLGGAAGAVFMAAVVTTSATLQMETNILNANAANSQKGFNSGVTSSFTITSGAITTGAIDTSVATTLVFTAQCANAGETITLEGYIVELIVP